MALGPLSRADAEPLLRRACPRSRRDALYARSGGNPLFLDALARRARLAAGEISPLVAEELAALSPAALAFARGAAVAGDPFAPELAAAAGSSTSRPRWTRSTS